MGRDYSRDPDASPSDPRPKWWQTIGGSQKPSPYETAAWTYTQTVVIEEDSCEEEPDGSIECSVELPEWWETLGGTLYPYATASWTYHQEYDYIFEFQVVAAEEFVVYDDWYFNVVVEELVFDNGAFNAPRPALTLDEAEYNEYGERGIRVRRTFAEVSVYDSLASYPGALPTIPQPLGTLATEPSSANAALVLADPASMGDTALGAETAGAYFADIETDAPPEVSSEIVGDGDYDGVEIEITRPSNKYDDRPPGTLLGKVSYEIYGSVATITSWTHYNWEDDTPVLKACKALINELPDCVVEVVVEDDPTAFWTSLGFKQLVKGDPYLRLFR